MKTPILLLLAVITFENAYSVCVPARREVDAPKEMHDIGVYHRVHPSGNYVIASHAIEGRGENHVAVIDLTNPEKPRVIETPMIDETYPVEGRWKYLASPRNYEDDEGRGMRYYPFEGETGVLKAGRDAQYIMNDPSHDQWYHSSAELPGSTDQSFKFRTMLYGRSYRDYTLTTDSDGRVSEEHTQTQFACRNLTTTLSAPILSKDGTEVAASVEDSGTVIYRINSNDSSCELVDSLGFFTGKVSFSPNPPSKGQIVFQGDATVMINGVPQPTTGVFIYDRDTRTTHKISALGGYPSYPGFTKDGRVIYMDRSFHKIVTVDPSQLNDDGSVNENAHTCIQVPGTETPGAQPSHSGSRTTRQ